MSITSNIVSSSFAQFFESQKKLILISANLGVTPKNTKIETYHDLCSMTHGPWVMEDEIYCTVQFTKCYFLGLDEFYKLVSKICIHIGATLCIYSGIITTRLESKTEKR